jgi:hypothetical protein
LNYCSENCVYWFTCNFFLSVICAFSFISLTIILASTLKILVLSSILYNIYTADQPTSRNTTVAEFANDKAIIYIHKDSLTASLNLQKHLDLVATWYKNWLFKVDKSKLLHYSHSSFPCGVSRWYSNIYISIG